MEYFDPHIPVIPMTREHAPLAGRKSIGWTREAVSAFDAALICTDHDNVDYQRAWRMAAAGGGYAQRHARGAQSGTDRSGVSAARAYLRILRHAHIRNFLLLFTSGGGARVLQVAAYPVLLYLYSPAQFGLFAGYSMIANVAAAFATMRYEWAIPVTRSEKHAAGILVLGASAAGILGCAMLLAFVLFPRTILTAAGLPGLIPVAWLSAFSMFGFATYNALTFWAVRFRAYAVIARTQILKVAGEVGSQLALGLAGFGIWGLVGGNVIGMCVGLTSLIRVGPLRELAPTTPARLYVLAKSYRDYPLYSGTAGLLSETATRVTLVALGAMFSPAALGFLWIAFAILDGPISVISTSAGRIFYQTASEIWRENPARLRRIYLGTAVSAFAISLAGGALAYFILPWLMHAALPQRWSGSIDLVRALIPAYIGQLTVMPFTCYGIVRRQSWQFGWNALYLAANLGVVALGHFIQSDLVTLIVILSLTRLCAYLLVIPIHLHILKPPDASIRVTHA